MFEGILLGSIQGITEWLPISSQGALVLAQSVLFKESLVNMIELAFFLHLGTALAALWYFRKDVIRLFFTLLQWKSANKEDKGLLRFLLIATVVSGSLGLLTLHLLEKNEGMFDQFSGGAPFVIGVLLLITAGIQLRFKKRKTEQDLKRTINHCVKKRKLPQWM